MDDLPDVGDLLSGPLPDLEDPRAKRRGVLRRAVDGLTAVAGSALALLAAFGVATSGLFSAPLAAMPALAFDQLVWPVFGAVFLFVAYFILAVLADGAHALWRWLFGRRTPAEAAERRRLRRSRLAELRARRAAAANDTKPSARGKPDEHT
ncbi:hypothetical protein ACFQ4O_14750 [Methylopila musalis]|uniref:Uncharacterized protein n=1 Tax=Methylopila musalis TaxID=1134781 RepID=A0ABW3ZAE9_9HYPH